ncbi:Hpt domain-containing protein [Glaciecola sp. 1036]|uniref:Hpt domain-containing protein n=1 Tax=Alteromonadaceae TaxID=72275 RepID=UPI003D08B1A8
MFDSEPLIDKTFGLYQLGGNQSLFNRMIGKFRHEFHQFPDLVKELLAQNDYEAAKLKVHTTKGITGNLGLKALFECSKFLDHQIKEKNVSPDIILAFEQIMAATCVAIDQSLDGNEAPPSQQRSKCENANQILLQKLKGHEFIDDSELRDLVEGLDINPQDKQSIIDAVEELDYETAIEIVQR